MTIYTGSGAAFIFRSALGSISDALNYNSLSSATLGITASSLAALLSTPQNVTLQASNDITVNSALLVDNPSGSGGTLTLQAGRNININAAIVTDDANLNLYANEKASTGVINAQRESGAAAITMGANGSINAGTGSVVARIDDGFGNTNKTAGNITLRTVSAANITALQTTQVGDIILNGSLTASGPGTSILLAAGANLINNAGAGALVTTDPSARWLVYSDHQNLISLGGLSPSFTANNCVYGGACSIVIPGTGNGVLYQYGPNLLTITVNTTRAYGDSDPSNAMLQALYNYSGFLPGDSASVLDVLPTASVTGLSSTSSAGTVGTIVLTGGSDNFYDYYLAGGNITVVKKDITATWNAPLSKAYGDLNPSVNTTNFTYTGLALGQNNSVITATGDFGTIDGTTGVGSYGVSAVFTAPNYNVTNTPVTTLTINKRDITAAWNGVLTRSYGDSNPTITSANFTYTGLVNGDLGSVITGSGDFGSVTAFTNVGSYSVGGVFSAANYNVTNTASTTLNITKRDITAVVGNASRTYGDSNPTFGLGDVVFSNFANGEDETILDSVLFGMPTATALSNAGTTHAIHLSVTDDNYNLIGSPTGTLTILKRDVTAIWNSALTKAYGDTNPTVDTTNFTYSNLANSDPNTSITATADFGTIDGTTGVGSYGVGVNFASINYNVTNTPVTTLTINKRDITAAWNGVLTRSYGDSNPTITSANFTYTGLVNGDLGSVITGSGDFGSVTAFTNVGSYSVGGVFSAANYNVTNTASTTLNITKRDITAVVGNASRIYGDSNPTPGLGDVVFSNFANGEDETILDSVLFGMPTATALSNAGTTHAIHLSVTDDNYNLIGSPTGTLTILKRDVTAIWNSALTKTYGDTNPTVDTTNFTYSNLANSDPNTSITATADFGTIDGTTGVGSYGVGVNFASINYNVTNTPVTSLTIGHRSLNITTNPQTKTYGDTDPVYTGTVTGLTANDATLVNWLYGPVGYTGNVGTYLISASAIDPNNRLHNYTRVNTYSNYVVNKRDITASVANRTRAYGDLLTGMTWQDVVWNNLVSPQTGSVLDTVTFLSPGELATDTVGTSRAIDIFVSDSNYNLVGFTSGTSTVIPAPLTITANHVTRFPADPAPVFTASYTGLKNNETSSVVTGLVFSTTALDNTTLGTYTISPSGGVASQYIITYIDGVYQIQAPPSVVDIGLPNDIRKVPEIFADRQYPSVYQKRLLSAQKKRGECKYSPDFVLVRCEDDRKHASAF
jgi:hypothetical protein